MSEMNSTYSLGRVGLRICGEYDSSVTYEELDVVSYNRSSYVAKSSSTNVLPTDSTYWMLLAQGNPINTITYASTLPETGAEGEVVLIPAN